MRTFRVKSLGEMEADALTQLGFKGSFSQNEKVMGGHRTAYKDYKLGECVGFENEDTVLSIVLNPYGYEFKDGDVVCYTNSFGYDENFVDGVGNSDCEQYDIGSKICADAVLDLMKMIDLGILEVVDCD